MKEFNKIKHILFFVFIFTILSLKSDLSSEKPQNTIQLYTEECVKSDYSCIEYEKEKRKEFEIRLVRNKFRNYNPNMKDDFIPLFINVMDSFKLNKHRDFFIAQILLESKGNHYINNSKNILIGSSGEYGICQILPSTALHVLSKINKKEKNKMIKLGATDFSNLKTEYDAKKWLSDKENNIILFGYIIKCNMNIYRNNVYKAMIAYNTGIGGINKFIEEGGELSDHHYYKGVMFIKNSI